MKTRTCGSLSLNTGGSACPVEWGKVKGAILVEHGQKLPKAMTLESFQEACHADRPKRIYPIDGFVEYAKNGGEAQVSPIGYGPNTYNGKASQTDAFTLPRFDEMLNKNLLRCANKDWDVYFWDTNNYLIGYNDGSDELAGIPMASVYPDATMYANSSTAANMVINFAHKDIEDSEKHFDYAPLDFNPNGMLQGLTECMLVEEGNSSNKYKIVEISGAYDRTPEFGETFASAVASLITGASSATYTGGLINITGESPLVPKAPSAFYTAGVKFIEIVKVVKAKA